MNMKKFAKPASIAALMMIGLLVITGCQGFFDPPTKLSADKGNGTLALSINGANGRTILPEAAVDSYKLTITDGTGAESVRNISGSGALSLAAGSYTLLVEGIVDGVVIAASSGTDTATIVAEQVASVSITLNPAASGDGTFAWDFSAYAGLTGLTLEIYDIDDDTTDLYANTPANTGSKVLASGVYNVKFSGTIGAEAYAWWEILYIYAGLTSNYGTNAINSREVLPPIYQVPAAGPGYFYLNLNNWQEPSAHNPSGNIEGTPVTGTLEADKLTVNFTLNNQRLNIKLSAAQIALIQATQAPGGYFKIQVSGAADPNNNFRYHLGDASLGGNWNATSTDTSGTFTANTAEKTMAWQDVTRDLPHFILQHRSATECEVEINWIKVTYYIPVYQVPAGGSDFFFLGLDDWQTVSTTDGGINGTPVVLDGTGLTASSLTVKFAGGSGQRLIIGLTPAQVNAIKIAAYINITIDGSATPDSSFRYSLANPTLGSGWQGTDLEAEGALSAHLNSGDLAITDTTGGKLSHFILQLREATETVVTINSIKITYVIEDEEFDHTAGTALAVVGGGFAEAPGILNAGTNSVRLLPDGSLLMHGRAENYAGFDLNVVNTDVATPTAGQIGLAGSTYYRVTIKGKAVSGRGTPQLVLANRPWSTLKEDPFNTPANDGKITPFVLNLTDKTGNNLTGQASTGESGIDSYTNRLRIRFFNGEVSFPDFILDSVEIYALDGADGDDVGSAVYAFNVYEEIDTAEAGTAIAEDSEFEATYSGIRPSGTATFKKLDAGGLLIYGRQEDYACIDIAADVASTLDMSTYYRITVTGRAVVTVGTAAEIVLANRPWSGLKSESLLDFGPVGTIQTFTVEVTNKTGADIMGQASTSSSGIDSYTNRPRIRVNGPGNPTFIIDSVVLIALDGEDGADDGAALVDITF